MTDLHIEGPDTIRLLSALGVNTFRNFTHDKAKQLVAGREALERMATGPTHRKVTLAWRGEDVASAMSSLFLEGPKAKYIDLPLANYATLPYDKIVKDGKTVGVSTYTGYSANEGTILSLSVIDAAFAEPGTDVTRGLGRARRRNLEADRRASRADQNPRHGRARALCRGSARGISAALNPSPEQRPPQTVGCRVAQRASARQT
jgi:glycine cleavage system aminomethyltransferase T